ncbi:ketopantoate reductase family protein [Sphingosinicella microcystinivorans]|uniref:2-dehydropantoate 2-reductase n=1 Tax=Sphingosinicella microcystinivorans TaxID=335406 RepID=A0AAD1D3W2_SPHMI|nr:ketopantoate reductase family protein [Sphingosinicella microcystinivorans]RKS85417.1 ketopantoate reductase [Sphingosinicella microcystinivorans]BBE33293.1 2-dehydropantoate 2-reductase [Sphingosinicella microcystinivorans]
MNHNRILVLGAGAVGGYFGGRMLAAGRDVTFLVRPHRYERLRASGLRISSGHGDLHFADPPLARTGDTLGVFDTVLIACKAYDLDSAIAAVRPAVGPETAILPLLNGMAHIGRLQDVFGREAIVGGLCHIGVMLDGDGGVRHFDDRHRLSYGELDGRRSDRIERLHETLDGCGFDNRLSPDILRDLWEKWVLLSSLAGVTCLMRGQVGDVVAADGQAFARALLVECAAVATAAGFPPSEACLQTGDAALTAAGSENAASTFRDIDRGGPTEGDHVVGDLVARGRALGCDMALLPLVDLHFRTYAARQHRESLERRRAGP